MPMFFFLKWCKHDHSEMLNKNYKVSVLTLCGNGANATIVQYEIKITSLVSLLPDPLTKSLRRSHSEMANSFGMVVRRQSGCNSANCHAGGQSKSSKFHTRDLKQRRQRRQRERQKTIVLISKTLALHVRYTLWYISLSSSAKQQREMTKFKVLWRT